MNGSCAHQPHWDTRPTGCSTPWRWHFPKSTTSAKLNILGNVFASTEFIRGLECKITTAATATLVRNYRPPHPHLARLQIPRRAVDPSITITTTTISTGHLSTSSQLTARSATSDQCRSRLKPRNTPPRRHRSSRRARSGDGGPPGQNHRPGQHLQQQIALYVRLVASACAVTLQGRYMASVSVAATARRASPPTPRPGVAINGARLAHQR